MELIQQAVPTMEKCIKHLKLMLEHNVLSAENTNIEGVSQFRWLLRLVTILAQYKHESSAALHDACELLLRDVTLPDVLVDDVLVCWSRAIASIDQAEEQAKGWAMTMQVDNTPSHSFETILVEKVIGFCEALETHSKEQMQSPDCPWAPESLADATTIRMLQIVSWLLRRGTGGRVVEGKEHFGKFIPWIIEAITHAAMELRSLGVRCLGLLAISEEQFFEDYYELLSQIAGNASEEESVRGLALQGLVDAAMVHTMDIETHQIKKQHQLRMAALNTLIYRSMDGSNSELHQIACEGTAKLLFTNIITDSRNCGVVLNQFFAVDSVTEENEVQGYNRLQQLLSVFVSSYVLMHTSHAQVLIQAIPEVIAFVSNKRQAENIPTLLSDVCTKLIGYGEQIVSTLSKSTSKTAVDLLVAEKLRAILFAAVCKDILTHYASATLDKNEKVLLKDAVKALYLTCQSSEWLTVSGQAFTALKSIDAVLAVVAKNVDKTSMKYLNTIRSLCCIAWAEQRYSPP